MKLTVATLQDHELVESYVGAFEGNLTDEERHAFAARFKAVYAWDGSGEDTDDEPSREMLFREVDLLSRDPAVEQYLLNASDDGSGGVVKG